MRKSILVAVLVVAGLVVAGPSVSQGEQGAGVEISDLSLEGEWIQIENKSGRETDVGGWMILSVGADNEVDQLFRFPATCPLQAGSMVTIHSGKEALNPANRDDVCGREQLDLYWDVSGSGPSVWRNKGDTACLIDSNLKPVDEYVDGGEGECREEY